VEDTLKVLGDFDRAWSQERFSTCLSLISKLIRSDPDRGQFYLHRAKTYLALGQFENAHRDACTSIDVKVNLPLAYLYQGCALIGRAKRNQIRNVTDNLEILEQAIGCIDQAKELEPQLADSEMLKRYLAILNEMVAKRPLACGREQVGTERALWFLSDLLSLYVSIAKGHVVGCFDVCRLVRDKATLKEYRDSVLLFVGVVNPNVFTPGWDVDVLVWRETVLGAMSLEEVHFALRTLALALKPCAFEAKWEAYVERAKQCTFDLAKAGGDRCLSLPVGTVSVLSMRIISDCILCSVPQSVLRLLDAHMRIAFASDSNEDLLGRIDTVLKPYFPIREVYNCAGYSFVHGNYIPPPSNQFPPPPEPKVVDEKLWNEVRAIVDNIAPFDHHNVDLETGFQPWKLVNSEYHAPDKLETMTTCRDVVVTKNDSNLLQDAWDRGPNIATDGIPIEKIDRQLKALDLRKWFQDNLMDEIQTLQDYHRVCKLETTPTLPLPCRNGTDFQKVWDRSANQFNNIAKELDVDIEVSFEVPNAIVNPEETMISALNTYMTIEKSCALSKEQVVYIPVNSTEELDTNGIPLSMLRAEGIFVSQRCATLCVTDNNDKHIVGTGAIFCECGPYCPTCNTWDPNIQVTEALPAVKRKGSRKKDILLRVLVDQAEKQKKKKKKKKKKKEDLFDCENNQTAESRSARNPACIWPSGVHVDSSIVNSIVSSSKMLDSLVNALKQEDEPKTEVDYVALLRQVEKSNKQCNQARNLLKLLSMIEPLFGILTQSARPDGHGEAGQACDNSWVTVGSEMTRIHRLLPSFISEYSSQEFVSCLERLSHLPLEQNSETPSDSEQSEVEDTSCVLDRVVELSSKAGRQTGATVRQAESLRQARIEFAEFGKRFIQLSKNACEDILVASLVDPDEKEEDEEDEEDEWKAYVKQELNRLPIHEMQTISWKQDQFRPNEVNDIRSDEKRRIIELSKLVNSPNMRPLIHAAVNLIKTVDSLPALGVHTHKKSVDVSNCTMRLQSLMRNACSRVPIDSYFMRNEQVLANIAQYQGRVKSYLDLKSLEFKRDMISFSRLRHRLARQIHVKYQLLYSMVARVLSRRLETLVDDHVSMKSFTANLIKEAEEQRKKKQQSTKSKKKKKKKPSLLLARTHIETSEADQTPKTASSDEEAVVLTVETVSTDIKEGIVQIPPRSQDEVAVDDNDDDWTVVPRKAKEKVVRDEKVSKKKNRSSMAKAKPNHKGQNTSALAKTRKSPRGSVKQSVQLDQPNSAHDSLENTGSSNVLDSSTINEKGARGKQNHSAVHSEEVKDATINEKPDGNKTTEHAIDLQATESVVEQCDIQEGLLESQIAQVPTETPPAPPTAHIGSSEHDQLLEKNGTMEQSKNQDAMGEARHPSKTVPTPPAPVPPCPYPPRAMPGGMMQPQPMPGMQPQLMPVHMHQPPRSMMMYMPARPATKICRFFLDGSCRYGPTCRDRHITALELHDEMVWAQGGGTGQPLHPAVRPPMPLMPVPMPHMPYAYPPPHMPPPLPANFVWPAQPPPYSARPPTEDYHTPTTHTPSENLPPEGSDGSR